MGLSAVSGAGCLECQLVYSSKSLLPVVKLWRRGGGAGILLHIYSRIWKGRGCTCVCHKRGLSSVFFVFVFLQWKEIDEVGVIQ